ncbi:hypothetical protein M422DRAFT_266145 [Sphaerobolus stellatus SS14]|uniref:Uncharacterized protein n=1 Tax=Sphaerobolus stellatus (strain SS14) TaxID=990650 RepID=A0A0C9TPQ0_SPHS4|nr:hypothetical protein M422DRAFT_266145 [Sphaerobolus stellatus SS14]
MVGTHTIMDRIWILDLKYLAMVRNIHNKLDLGDTSADRRGLMGEISLRHQFQSSRTEGWLSVFNTVDMICDPFTDSGSKVLTQSDSGNRSPELVQYPPPVTSQAFPESSP